VSLLDARTARVILTILFVAAGLAFVWAAWRVLVAFLFAILFAYLINPTVRLLMRRLRLTRGQAIAAVYLVIFAGLAALLLFIGPGMVHEATKFANTLPDLYQRVATGQIAWQLGAEHGWSYDTRVKIQQFLVAHSSDINHFAQSFAARLARAGTNAWWLILIPILAVFFLKDGEEFSQAVVDIFERRRQREFMEAVMNDVNLMLAHFVRAQLALAAITMSAYLAGLHLMRVPYASILAVIAGFLEFIPIVGPLISAVLIIGVAMGSGYVHILVPVLFLGVWRIIEDYVISPRVMGRQLALHPLAVLFGILAGAEIAGLIGVYLSIPMLATIRIFWRRWHAYSQQRVTMVPETAEFSHSSPPEVGKP
jgi:predicted PurR-regulated permease PerM